MEKTLQEKLVDGIIGVFKDASKQVIKDKDNKSDGDDSTNDKKTDDKTDDDKKVEKKTPEPTINTGITAEQMLEGLSKMGENIVTAVREAVKTPEQVSKERKIVAVDAVKDYLAKEGFDLKGQSIDITFSETKKGAGITDGGGLELRLVKDGEVVSKSGADDNEFETVESIPEDVAKAANKHIWRDMLLPK